MSTFDAAGVQGCVVQAGFGTVCSPVWSAALGPGLDSSPTVANGIVFVASRDHNVYALDAAGVTDCGGTPKTCQPLWLARVGRVTASPVVANGVVYGGSGPYFGGWAFDAAGSIGCAGAPKVCHPMWTTSAGHGVWSEPVVVDGFVYFVSDDQNLYAYNLP